MKGAADILATIIIFGLIMGFISAHATAVGVIALFTIAVCIIYAIGNGLIDWFKNRSSRIERWKFRNGSQRYAKYVMHVEEVAYRYARLYNKKKEKVMAKYRKRHPYITISGKAY